MGVHDPDDLIVGDLFIRGEAADLLGARGVEHLARDLIPFPDAQAGGLRRQIEAFLGRLQGRLRRTPLGNVLYDGDKVIGPPVGRPGKGDRQLGPNQAPVFAVVTLLQAVAVALARQQRVDQSQVRLQIVGVTDVLEGQPGQFSFGIAQHLAQPGVHGDPAAIQGDVGDADGRLFEDRPKPGLAFGQGVFGPPPRRHVTGDIAETGPRGFPGDHERRHRHRKPGQAFGSRVAIVEGDRRASPT